MVTKRARNEGTRSREKRGTSAGPAGVPLEREATKTMTLIQIRPGLFLNVDQIVSVRVLPQDEDNVYAVLKLSNGEQQDLTRDEFTRITGEEPRLPLRRAEQSKAK